MLHKLLFIFQQRQPETNSIGMDMKKLCSLFVQFSGYLYGAPPNDHIPSSTLLSQGSALYELCETIVANFRVFSMNEDIVCLTIGMSLLQCREWHLIDRVDRQVYYLTRRFDDCLAHIAKSQLIRASFPDFLS